MQRPYKYDVFVSFSHDDEIQVTEIYKKLERFGLRIFWSKHLSKGKSFPSQLDSALAESQHFAMYCTKQATSSQWVNREWETFLNFYHHLDP